MKEKAFYSRNAPLLERKHVPCQLISYPKDGKNGLDLSALPKRKAFFTLRVLQGHRPTPGCAGATERAIRLELSDEYRKIEPRSSTSTGRYDGHERGAPCLSSPIPLNQRGEKNNHIHPQGPIHFPAAFRHQGIPGTPRVTRDKAQDEATFDDMHDFLNHHAADDKSIQLYELEVGESDFAKLRQDQALLVDFSNFSKSFIDLLMACDLGENDSEPIYGNESKCDDGNQIGYTTTMNPLNPLLGLGHQMSTSCAIGGTKMNESVSESRFICRIEDFSQPPTNSSSWGSSKRDEGAARFSIVESNQFRELIHLSLGIRPGTDASVSAYLSSRIAEVIGQNIMLKYQVSNEKERGTSAEKAFNEVAQKYNQLVKVSENEKIALAQEADESIQKENTRRCEELQIVRRLNEDEIKNLKESMAEMQQTLSSKILKLEAENQALIAESADKGGTIGVLEKDVSLHKSQLDKAHEEISRLQKELSSMDEGKSGLEQQLKQCQSFVSKLEVSNERYEEKLIASQNELKKENDTNVAVQQEVEKYADRLQTTEQDLCKTKDEYAKVKDLLGRYQRERQEMKRRMRLKVEMIQKQEEILASKEVSFMNMQENLVESEMMNKQLKHELGLVKTELDQAKERLSANEKTLSSNQQVIAWLNKEATSKSNTTRVMSQIHNQGNMNISKSGRVAFQSTPHSQTQTQIQAQAQAQAQVQAQSYPLINRGRLPTPQYVMNVPHPSPSRYVQTTRPVMKSPLRPPPPENHPFHGPTRAIPLTTPNKMHVHGNTGAVSTQIQMPAAQSSEINPRPAPMPTPSKVVKPSPFPTRPPNTVLTPQRPPLRTLSKQ